MGELESLILNLLDKEKKTESEKLSETFVFPFNTEDIEKSSLNSQNTNALNETKKDNKAEEKKNKSEKESKETPIPSSEESNKFINLY